MNQQEEDGKIMALSTQQWVGVAAGAAVLGYFLWPKKAKASTSTATPTGGAAKPGTATPKGGSTTYTAPPKSSSGGMTDSEKQSLGYGNGTAMGNQDASAGLPKNVGRAASAFSAVATDIRESSAYKYGFDRGYNEAYDALAKALASKKIGPASTEDTGGSGGTDVSTEEVGSDTSEGLVSGTKSALLPGYGRWYRGSFIPAYSKLYR